MLQDLAYAFRQLRRSPVFALAAILTLALGIGANAAIYAMLDAVAFRSLPVGDPQRLVKLQLLDNGKPLDFGYPLYREMAARQQVAEGLLAVSDYPLHAAVLRGRGAARTVNAVLVSGNYFQLLEVSARLGRVFSEADDRAGAPPAAVVSDAFWEREFARSPAALGQPLTINKALVTIIGVTPPAFSGETQGNNPDVWLPMSVAPLAMATDWLNAPNATWLTVIARLRPEVSPREAQAAFDALHRSLDERHSRPPEYRLELNPAGHGIAQLQTRFENPLLFLMAVAGMVLLIACCNLANLLLGRTMARTHEIGVRQALGARPARLLRQLLTESLLLAALGSLAALALARWGSRTLAALASEGRNWNIPVDLDWRVLAFTAVIAIAATCLFGIAPALAAGRVDLRSALEAGRPSLTAGLRRHMLGKVLVVAQISMALMLLSGAALLARSLWSLRHQDFGFHDDHVLMAQLPWEFSPTMMARYAALRQPLYDRTRSLPGVRYAAFCGFGPMGGDQHTGPISSAARPSERADNNRIVHVSPDYFEAMGIPIAAGRPIGRDDRASAPKVAVLSETAAQKLFGGATAVGQLVSLNNTFDAQKSLRVVGVARDVRFANPGDPFGFVAYVPMEQAPAPITTVILRSTGDPAQASGNLRATLHALDPDMVIASVRPLADTIDAQLTDERLMASLALVFGGLALALTCCGVYGVISYAVERRTREIGIRLALGAGRAQVTASLMREVATLVTISALVGGAGAAVITRAMHAVLFGFGPNDVALLVAVALVLMAVAMLAGFLPARRAARLDPVAALR